MKNTYNTVFLILLFAINGFSQQFSASYSSDVLDEPFTGNVIVYMSKENKTPKNEHIGFNVFPVFSVAVKNIHPGQAIIIDDKATSYPTTLSNIERGVYYVQIVWDRNLGGRSIAQSPGNLYNNAEIVHITKNTNETFKIVATQIIPPVQAFQESEFIKEIKVPSSLLSTFHGKPMTINAAVILPKEYDENPSRTFPVLFTVSGYGGDYHRLSGHNNPSHPLGSIPIIEVYLDGNCSLGHSVYANSDNNGPWGDALTTEFIPYLEKQYKCNGVKLLTGHSSGGWTVLWLQTQYPKVFDACWSSSPDPVDFRNFTSINLYEDKNMFYDANGSLRSVATVGGFIPWTTMKKFYQMENVVYRGEQMHSFNAVFSKRGDDGLPLEICNHETGEINPIVIEHWKKYDIALYLRNNWEDIKPDLDGKVRVSVGDQDNFHLNHPVYLLEAQMKELNSSFQFAYYPGDHFTVHTPEYKDEGYQFLENYYLETVAKQGQHYQKHKDYNSLNKVVELMPLEADTSYVKSVLGTPIDMGFDYRYLIDSTGVNGCVIGAVFHLNDNGKIDQKWVGEICE